MIVFILSVLALLSSVRGLCYSPMLHGFAPDLILPTMLSSDIHCPPPHVFDHFHCMCVDPSVVKVRVPTEGRTSLELSLLNKQRISHLASPLIGLPDTHVPVQSSSPSSSWPAVSFQIRSSSGPSGSIAAGRVVPVLNPYGAPFNLPVKSRLVKDAGRAVAEASSLSANGKQQEILEKVRWQERLQREAAAVELAAAAELASAARAAAAVSAVAAASAVPVSTGGESTLDLFMRDTLRRILYGY